jgi:hypothetical protein
MVRLSSANANSKMKPSDPADATSACPMRVHVSISAVTAKVVGMLGAKHALRV